MMPLAAGSRSLNGSMQRVVALALTMMRPARPGRRSRSGRAQRDAGFSQNRDQPIRIEAASLEMRDKTKEATFAGNVKVMQGDTTMTSKTLVVFYDQVAPSSPPPPTNAEGGQRRADAVGDPGAGRQFVDQAGLRPGATSSSRKRTRS